MILAFFWIAVFSSASAALGHHQLATTLDTKISMDTPHKHTHESVDDIKVHTRTHTHTHTHTHTRIHTHLHTHLHTHTHTHTYTRTRRACKRAFERAHIHTLRVHATYMHTFACISICMRIHKHKHKPNTHARVYARNTIGPTSTHTFHSSQVDGGRAWNPNAPSQMSRSQQYWKNGGVCIDCGEATRRTSFKLPQSEWIGVFEFPHSSPTSGALCTSHYQSCVHASSEATPSPTKSHVKQLTQRKKTSSRGHARHGNNYTAPLEKTELIRNSHRPVNGGVFMTLVTLLTHGQLMTNFTPQRDFYSQKTPDYSAYHNCDGKFRLRGHAQGHGGVRYVHRASGVPPSPHSCQFPYCAFFYECPRYEEHGHMICLCM